MRKIMVEQANFERAIDTCIASGENGGLDPDQLGGKIRTRLGEICLAHEATLQPGVPDDGVFDAVWKPIHCYVQLVEDHLQVDLYVRPRDRSAAQIMVQI
jgi:hypothetical protein